MDTFRKYPVPDTRLPFVNTEIEVIERSGVPFAVTASFGGASGGALFFFNPDTGEHFRRRMPEGIPGAYVLRKGPDGHLYLGAGNGDLLRYRPDEDRFETLVTGEITDLIWGGTVVGEHLLLEGTPGRLLVYNLKEDRLVRTFNPLDPGTPPSLYAHNLLCAPDGRALIGMNIPSARLFALELPSLRLESLPIEGLDPDAEVYPLTFLHDGQLLLNSTKEGLFRASYPDLRRPVSIEHSTAVPGRHVDRNWVDGRYYLVDSEHAIHRLSTDGTRLEEVGRWPTAVRLMVGWQDQSLVGVSVEGNVFRWTPGEAEGTEVMDLQPWGALEVHALAVSERHRTVFGSPFINGRFWKIDLDSGNGTDLGRGQPGGGQVNQIVPDPVTGRLLLVSYTRAAVMSFDPGQPVAFGRNPKLLGEAVAEGQMRPTAAQHDGTHLWYVTNAHYGHLDGALCRLNPETGELRVWRNLLSDRNPCSIQIDPARRRIYLGSTIRGDCDSAEIVRTEASLGIFDMDELRLVETLTPFAGVESLYVVTLLDDGDLIVTGAGQTWRWRPSRARFTPFETDLSKLSALARDDHGWWWAVRDGDLYQLEFQERHAIFHPALEGIRGHHLSIDGSLLAYSRGTEVFVHSLDSLRACEAQSREPEGET